MKQPDKIITVVTPMTRNRFPEKEIKYITLGTADVSDLPLLDWDKVEFLEDPFEKKIDVSVIRMPEFGFQFARPESFGYLKNNRWWRPDTDNFKKNSDNLRKMVRRQIRKAFLQTGLKMCRTEKERTEFLLRFLINHRK